MTHVGTKLVLSAVGLAFVLATPADAASKRKHRTMSRPAIVVPYAGAAYGPTTVTFSNHVLGADPDPNIRFQLLRDLSGFFGGGGP
jgi:hypothetical protein